MLDFSTIQTEAYNLFLNNPHILSQIQEQIVFLLVGEKQNIAVVGDNDQGLYRFRSATIRNILEFPNKFEDGRCKRVSLVVYYRSDSKIIDFYNNWMSTTGGKSFKFEWDKFRYDKTIRSFENSKLKSLSVVKVSSKDDEDE